MPLPVNQIKFFDEFSINDSLEKTSGPGLFRGTQGEIFYFYSDDGEAKYRIDAQILGKWREIAEGTIPADDLHVVEISFFVPKARVRITAASAPLKISVEAYGYPAVYIRESEDPARELGRSRAS
jgi:hypothetical protein